MALAIALPWMTPVALIVLSLLLGALAAACQAAYALRLLRRSWLFLAVITLVYGWATPGTALVPEWTWLSPSGEGLQAGALQAWRLALLIVGLALATGGLAPRTLIAGLYTLLQPFGHIGVPVRSFALRVSLVLEYAQAPAPHRTLAERLDAAFGVPSAEQEVAVELPPFSRRDAWFGLAIAALLVALLW